MTTGSGENILCVTVNSPTEKEINLGWREKGYVSKYNKQTNEWSRNLSIVINSPSQEEYNFDIWSKGFVKKQKSYSTKWT
jgi:hypothetical protein